MADKIKVVGLSHYRYNKDTHFYSFALAMIDNDMDIIYPVQKFIQTESMTENLVAVTDYGAVYFNKPNTDKDATIELKVVYDKDGELTEYVASLTVDQLVNKKLGATL